MAHCPGNWRIYSHRALPMLLLVCAVSFAAAFGVRPAAAQNILAVVNGQPITALDVEQRSKLVMLTTRKPISKKEAIDELIGDYLKIAEGKRFGVDLSQADIDSSYAGLAQRMRLSADQLSHQLTAQGVRPETLKQQIRAQIVWNQIVRGRYQSSLQVGERDINAQGGDVPKEMMGFEYTLRPVVVLVAKNRGAGELEVRKRLAENLRNRFDGCESGANLVQTLGDVAIKTSVTRNSIDLAPELRKILDSTPVGKLTPPEVTAQGIEMFALCAKKETKMETAEKRAAREKAYTAKFDAQAKQYLDRLRRQAMIEYR